MNAQQTLKVVQPIQQLPSMVLDRNLGAILRNLFIEMGLRQVTYFREAMAGHRKDISLFLFAEARLEGYTRFRQPRRSWEIAEYLSDLSSSACRRPQPVRGGSFVKGWNLTRAMRGASPIILARAEWVKVE